MLKIDSSTKPAEDNVEHREIYEYGLMNGVISEAGTNYDLTACQTTARKNLG